IARFDRAIGVPEAGLSAGLFACGDLLGTLLDPITTPNLLARLADEFVGVNSSDAAELGDDVRVGAQRHRRTVPELFGELDDRPRRAARLLAGDDLAVDVLLLDQERALAHVAPLEGKRFLGSDAGVGEDADERRVISAAGAAVTLPQQLDEQRRDRLDGPLP